ncbi:hypothetical protein [Nocardiopsis lambiniae]|uniref:Integral membrane protein n=1 Tax=Nocardiopsis lambiniae TaxID=3075539 RepID=A0ABU2M6J4_9ACTN|nr:hypothetical protein [Nocardiopsis sp. DSM 44743]MDT0328276.1 hypothetical protein [Nocardiopsis sp. DSM 44743]
MSDHTEPLRPRVPPSSASIPLPTVSDPDDVPAAPSTATGRDPGDAGPSTRHDRVELRVHGVSGGQAEELLDVEPAMRVGGDRLAGFFRWRRGTDTETVPGVRREIFAWGNLTSGSASRAFWLLLLPFMLVNVAYWMRPGRAGRDLRGPARVADNVYGAGVRLLALSLTVLITVAAAGVGVDLLGWQCAAGLGEECVRARPWSAFWASPESVLSAPGPALVTGAVVPLAVVVVLGRLSRRTAADYEIVSSSVPPAHDPRSPLSHVDFWRNSEIMARLRSAHIAMAVGVLAVLITVPPLLHDLSDGSPGPWGPALAGALGVTVLLSAASVLVPGVDPLWNARADRLCRLLRDITLVLAVATVVYVLWPRPGWVAEGRLPGHAAVLNTLFTAQVALILVTLAAALVLYTADRAHDGVAMRGMAGPATAALGALAGGAFSAALVYQGALWLSGCGSLSAPGAGCLPLETPTIYSWLQLAIALEAVLVVIVAGLFTIRLRRDTRAHVAGVTEDYARSVRDRRTWDIARARALGRMTEVLPAVLTALLVPAVVLGALVLYSVMSGHLMPGGPEPAATAVADRVRVLAQGAVSVLTGVGSLLGGAALVALMWIGRSAYRDRPTRQAVGALWDVGTFWPRVAHPLAPPSYAERAVPQLVARVARMTREGTDVVLSGHSQGSVLAAATVWQLPDDCLGRVALITHGSPLDRLYARYFPGYFGPGPFADLCDRVAGWRNLWRITDAIAGPVRVRSGEGIATVGPAEPLPDPRSYDALPGEARRPEILGHSYYTDDPAYSGALRRTLTELEEAYQGP